jgi:hypothetical protein
MQNYGFKNAAMPVLSLFTSASTLVCCALPALMVSIGAGATLAGLVSTAPWLVALTKYKGYMFLISGLLLALAGFLMWRARNAPCPTDKAMAKACMQLRKFNFIIYIASVLIYVTGFFFAFIAEYVFY